MANITENVVLKLVDEFSATAKRVNSSMSILQKTAGLLAGGAGLFAVTKVLKDSFSAYAESEKVSTQLSQALKTMGITSKAVQHDYELFAKQLQRTSSFTDEQVVSVERLLTQSGLYGDQLKRTTQAVVDFAEANGVEVEQAARLFGRAANGSKEALSRYGVQVSDAEYKTKGLNAVLEASEARFKGFAEAAQNTSEGRIQQFKKSVGDLQESLGGFIARFDQKFGVTKFWTEQINNLNDSMSESSEQIKETTDEIKKNQDAAAAYAKKVQSGISDEQKKLSESEQKKYNEAREDFQKYYRDLIKESGSSFQKINSQRETDLNRLQEYQRKGVVSTKEAEKAKQLIIQKSFQDQAKVAESGFNAISDLAKGNINGAVNNIKQFLPVQAQSIVGIAQSAFGALTSIVDMFASDTRGAFGVITDQIAQIDAQVSDFEQRLERLRNREKREKQGYSGAPEISSENISGFKKALPDIYERFLKSYGGNKKMARSAFNKFVKRFRYEVSPEEKAVTFFYDNQEIGGYDYRGGRALITDMGVAHSLGLQTQAQASAFILQLFRTLRDEMNLKAPKGMATGGYVSPTDTVPAMLSPGEFVMSRRGVNRSTLGALRYMNDTGMMPSGAQTINIHAMDAASFEEFMKRKGASVLRRMTGRQGYVIANQRGLNGNI